MKVSPNQPFRLVYSLFQHEYLGYLFESFVVAIDESSNLTLRYQNISAKNAKEFSAGLKESDYKIIKLMDSMQQDVIIKKFHTKKISPADFFLTVYDKEKGNKLIQENIESYLEIRRSEILARLEDQPIYTMARDGNPADEQVILEHEKATVRFHFKMEEEKTHYYPTIMHEGSKVKFQHEDARIICSSPAWLMVNGKLYSFQRNPDGKKLKPFLKKWYIGIPKKIEETYFQKFVAPLIESFDVRAEGFEIREVNVSPQASLKISEASGDTESLFDSGSGKSDKSQVVFSLNFQYKNHQLNSGLDGKASVSMEKTGERSYIFYKVQRDLEAETQIRQTLEYLGLPIPHGRTALPKHQGISWLNANLAQLQKEGISIKQQHSSGKKYFIGQSSIVVNIQEKQDWFDIHATIKFGAYEIPFVKLRQLILSNKRELILPNGEIAVIPEEWLTKYSDLLHFIEEEDGAHTLNKHHLALVQELETGNFAKVTIDRKLENLRGFSHIEDSPIPADFNGTLRPYQKAGYNWLQFLNQYNFGGCLADDMGLGKTVQTLAMLLAQKQLDVPQASLLIMPTSLLYNWEEEAKKFTPSLKVFRYTGTNRVKDIAQFEGYDLILTSYGIARIDIDLLEDFYFNYIILDESQVIKNPSSNIAKSVRRLKSRRRLILTGTPLENSTMDLWSQMNFANPGLLGTQAFFKKEFQLPIEKKQDEERSKRLHTLIKPFILRRHKSHVALELPPKIEQVKFCEMSKPQARYYEEIKSYYRNKILEHIEGNGVAKSQFLLLQGLTQLRQIANHPLMVKDDFEGESGKMKNVLHTLESGLIDNHKILIFSQFVKHLTLLRKEVEARGISYAYLDGSVKDRQKQVNLFQNDESTRVFLISLRAGGLGLNLTAADYVFILDPWWNPAIEAQAVDRAHRIGQQNTVVNYKFISKDTVEEKILALQQQKLKLASDLITTEESFIKSLSQADISSLLD